MLSGLILSTPCCHKSLQEFLTCAFVRIALLSAQRFLRIFLAGSFVLHVHLEVSVVLAIVLRILCTKIFARVRCNSLNDFTPSGSPALFMSMLPRFLVPFSEHRPVCSAWPEALARTWQNKSLTSLKVSNSWSSPAKLFPSAEDHRYHRI